MQVTYDTILRYGELTQDPNPIHYDRAFAVQTEMGGIIAQGTLALAVLWASLAETFGQESLDRVALDVRFVKPVREDDVLTADGWAEDAAAPRFRVQVSNQRGENLVEGVVQFPASARDSPNVVHLPGAQ